MVAPRDVDPAHEDLLHRQETILGHLGAFERRRALCAAVRARAVHEAENGNRGSAYFFGLEKSRGKHSLIHELVDPRTDLPVPTSLDPVSPMNAFMTRLFASPDANKFGVTIDDDDVKTDQQAEAEVLD